MIFVAIEARRAEPVLPGEIEGILDAQSPLLGTVDQEQSAERPESLAAKALFGLLVEQNDAFAGVGDFASGGEARESRANDDHIGVESHRRSTLTLPVSSDGDALPLLVPGPCHQFSSLIHPDAPRLTPAITMLYPDIDITLS